MAKRKRTVWRSSARRRANLVWISDSADGIPAPSTATVTDDNIFDSSDWESNVGRGEKVRLVRILFHVWWNADSNGVQPVNGASANIDMGLVVISPDDQAAAFTAGLRIQDYRSLDAKVLREHSIGYSEADQVTAVGVVRPARLPDWRCNMRCNLVLREPQALYFVQKLIDIEANTGVYEYSYRASMLYELLK